MLLKIAYFLLCHSSHPVPRQTSGNMCWAGRRGKKEKRNEGVNPVPTVKHWGCLPVFGKAASHTARTRRRFWSLWDALMKVPQYKPSWAGMAGGEAVGRGPTQAGEGGKKPQAGTSWQDCKNAVVFRFPSSPSPLLWTSSFTCPSPSLPGTAHSAKKFGERDGAASPGSRNSHHSPSSLVHSSRGEHWKILQLLDTLWWEERSARVHRALPACPEGNSWGCAWRPPLFPLWLQRASRHPAPVSKQKCARADGS